LEVEIRQGRQQMLHPLARHHAADQEDAAVFGTIGPEVLVAEAGGNDADGATVWPLIHQSLQELRR